MDKQKYYITTAIAYTSRKPHIGNSYEIVFTDAVARLKRMQGRDVFFLTGTDEHGQKIEEAAKAEGTSPKAYVDRIAGEIKDICDLLNTSYDKFIRTTDDYHEKAVQKIFQKLYDQGDIYKAQYEGWYCLPDESFFTDSQLVDGKCPECGREVQKASEEAYFFKMSKYQKQLEDHIEKHPGFIFPESRKKEMVNNFLKPGLQDLCVSRSSFKWGVPVPFDENHVIYVWIDALSNYITALDYDVDNPGELYKKYWPAETHVIGKDILRFHTIYWPILLMALGEPLPESVFGHPWMLSGEDKMSKSRGNTIYADDLAKLIGVDGVRYYMLAEMPYANDGTITYERVFERYNSDLANTLGNLVNRSIAMTQKYFGGTLPAARKAEPIDGELAAAAIAARDGMIEKLDAFRAADAIDAMMGLAKRANKYIDETAPWQLGKDEAQKDRLASVLAGLLEAIRFLGVLLTPLLPETAERIFGQLNCPPEHQTLASIGAFSSAPAFTVGKPEPLFARLDTEKLIEELLAGSGPAGETETAAKPEGMAAATACAPPEKAEITYDDFMKTKLVCGEIRACEKVEKADKLLKLTVFDGERERTVLSGIAMWYTPEALTGKKIVLVANLKPAKMRGIMSEGMLLAADGPDGAAKVIFLPEDLPAGSSVH
ncbi:methionine--tRNA ligase [Ruminococcaceae bacterium OttesenSCG-928-D13]|nr:methionine--tRNA ligase [Ruminococcaceae bacterium OttesenSCG-928-D13]